MTEQGIIKVPFDELDKDIAITVASDLLISFEKTIENENLQIYEDEKREILIVASVLKKYEQKINIKRDIVNRAYEKLKNIHQVLLERLNQHYNSEILKEVERFQNDLSKVNK